MTDRLRTTAPHRRSFDRGSCVGEGEAVRRVADDDAMELTIEADVAVERLAELPGWPLVRTEKGEEGWIPVRCLG